MSAYRTVTSHEKWMQGILLAGPGAEEILVIKDNLELVGWLREERCPWPGLLVSSVLEPVWGEERTDCSKLFSDLHWCTVVHTRAHTHTKINK